MQVAILVIGSLLWDDAQHRAEWRRTRLDVDFQIPVKVPIRYGRRSTTRGNTFTMVFAGNEATGQARLIPCISLVSDLKDLVDEAIALWKAERKYARDGEVGSSWGCVGILPRDQNFQFANEWSQYFQEHSHAPIAPVDSKGRLNIPWPVRIGEPLPIDIDILISTSTQPESTLPTAIEIADAWIEQNEGYERYFFENVQCGIRTPDDLKIWRRIEERSPDWLNNPAYAEVISLLREESTQSG
ncbi:MAG: hypothetical protein GXO35_05030 [Gammaproteobacteria bacterium]|nr:hypothetical protein [Gammaproteobacteria bacterium]